MKIATYNVNGVNGRLPVLLKWLNEFSPDVACLQELKAPQEKFPVNAIQDAGYNAIWLGQKSWNGVAILCKNGISLKELRKGLPGDKSDEQSRYLELLVNEDFVLGCLYLPNGNPAPGPKFDYKLNWFERLNTHVAELKKYQLPFLLAGDFNVIPTEFDVYKPERWVNDALFRMETREAFQRLLGLGLTDGIRALYPDQKIYTFYDYFRNAYARDAGLRIDHFLLEEQMLKRLKSAGVDREVRGWEKTSDHCPVWIEID